MTQEGLQGYCLCKKGVSKSYPFDKYVAVYKLKNKIFALSKDGECPLQINLKCEPLYALELRNLYTSVKPGYHMNKKHWNTVVCEGDMDDQSIYTLIDDSYRLVFEGFSKKDQASILEES